jgi:hypothetical protein
MYLQQVCQFPSVSCHNMNETLSKAAPSTNKESEDFTALYTVKLV